ncbi:glycoside hydrolase family 2 TIM barrel-domain containing protein [Petrocella sp. FN5]|uniref:glycoside hydrolase family 2 TIM barrel-domain containing protein n=1 Tax=Petrocella sp. FN5 TaxID=3032002 RepID=UPI0023DCC467|nr:glycoside hydrolase family 2 TIM barrel-domain containing protein [Petrocella sp. FN5]MDF1617713.1 glycoside hydrolase family 2 TIM barrel-domain containing protein [Petrocella sp. FN5]
MALIKKKTGDKDMDKEYEGRCKMKVYDTISDWKQHIQSDRPINPMTHIEDLYLRCDFSQDYIRSIMKVNFRICNLLDEMIPVKIKLFLHEDVDQEPIGAMDTRMVAQGRTTTKGYFEVPISTIKLWSDQEPYLYEVLVIMTDHFDKILQIVGFQYGFREIKTSGAQMLMNNKPLLLKGINYHKDLKKASHPETYNKDLMLLKQYNMNALIVDSDNVDDVFYECCNQLGFYVVTEINSINKNIEDIITKVVSVIGNARNHPCSIMWSLKTTLNKNENLAVKKVIMSLDDRRSCMIQGDEAFYISDVFVMEMLHEKTIERIGKGLDIRGDMLLLKDRRFSKGMDEYTAMAYKKKPAVLCTNRQTDNEELINLRPVMESMHVHTRWHGGFIGGFMNYFSHQNHSGGKNFEVRPLAYEIKKAFEAYHISFDSQTAFYSIKNLNLLAEDIEVRVTIQEDGTPIKIEGFDPVSIKPGEVTSGVIKSWLQLNNEGILYHIIFEVLLTKDMWWAKKGHILASEQFEKEGYHPIIFIPKSNIDCTINESSQIIEVVGEKTRYEFDKKTGHITQIKVDNKEILKQPIRPILRSLSDTESDATEDDSQRQVKAYKIEKKGSQVDLHFEISVKTVKTLLQIKYEIFSTGELNIYYEGNPNDYSDRLGSMITLRGEKNQVNWFGKGPHPACFEGMTSTQMGLYQMDLLERSYEDNGHLKCHTYQDIRWMTLMGTDGEGVMVESMDKNGFDADFTAQDKGTTALLINHTCNYRFLFMEAL